jgi:molecular chaperone HscB
MARIARMITQTISQMAVDFETPDPDRLAAVREKVRQMQFLNKLHAEAEALEARLEEEVY